MLRFRPQPTESLAINSVRNQTASPMRWKLWMLIIMLGLVIASMRELNQPSTIRRLDQLFGVAEQGVAEQTAQQSEQPLVFGKDDTFQLVVPESVAEGAVPTPGAPVAKEAKVDEVKVDDGSVRDLTEALAAVRDNTFFRPAESEAWFGLFRRLLQMDDQQLGDATHGELTYAQLVKQPDFYRGQIVTIQGTLRREEVEQAPPNALGIETYHRLVIEPRGGGLWPIMVFCLELPEGLSRGQNLQAPITVTGCFFKNWSYAWEDGLGIAPVVLARGVDWQPKLKLPQKKKSKVTRQGVTITVLAASLFAVLVALFVLRNTRRPQLRRNSTRAVSLPDEDSSTETIHEQLERLSAAESQE